MPQYHSDGCTGYYKDIRVRNISAGLLNATCFASPPLLPNVREPAWIIQGSLF